GLESNEPYDEGGDCADIGNDSAPTKSTHKPRVNIVDSSARNKDNIQFEIEVSVSNLKSVDVTGSTSSRKDTRKEKYAIETSICEGIQEYATKHMFLRVYKSMQLKLGIVKTH
ncbi:hypothetical protein Tco_0288016, partial [Tanacetum coccineum]